MGAYKIYSRKNEEAYPDRSDSFYADANFEAPKVDITEDHSSATVTVTLWENLECLYGRVFDSDSGTAAKAELVFMDEEGNHRSVSVDGKYRAHLPAGKDVTLNGIDPVVAFLSSLAASGCSPFVARTRARDAYGHSVSKP